MTTTLSAPGVRYVDNDYCAVCANDGRTYLTNAFVSIADALITYLVRYDLGESRSEPTDPGHFIYFVSVTWGALYQFAEANGIDLPAALAGAATIPGG